MKQISLYHPQHSSAIIHVHEGAAWEELGFRQFHENNKELLFIDWQPLFNWINSQTNTDVKFDMDFKGKYPQIISPNIVEHAGAFASVCESVEVQFFNSASDETGFNASVNLSYTSWRGGSNGMTIGEVYYNHENKQWDFVSTKMRTLTYRQKG